MKKINLLLILCCIVLLPLGCKKEQPVVKKPMAAKVQPAVTQEQKATEETKKAEHEEINYDSKGKRDPFLSLVEITKQKPVKKRGASPFESYDIDEVKLLAIASDKDKYYALIRLPDKKNYTITEGMTLGLQGGKIVSITSDKVVIRENIKDYRGNMKPRDAILKLHKGEEE
jgi:type IV pilus assembly protein PilP